ncbi:N-acetylglucosamine-6-phosphate deacetylase [Gracilibacillus halophilus YIM-C55.5]|uniref:N-acetylglucosamine-6-phosphate deacetylase n=1 Tax=Gracilibacillus halophilus YIM-C55.5 TaxID=1308866 RepID=N4WBP5_9BACI|nr:N-acetylglucosamine-6-phosphate deacetylase [Gracilibacillus halophilus]ENH97718.1 N-acetylglucosamine-6-phosphate deacetylase [Gracilibacillus halophilus YIM-C55.5]
MYGFIIKDVTIYSETGIYQHGYIQVEDGIITAIGDVNQLDQEKSRTLQVIQPSYKSVLIPGMIDVHIHGVAGADTMDATQEAIQTMATHLPKEGTTSFLATTMTQEEAAIEEALVNVSTYMRDASSNGTAEVLGIHLEGPFLSKKRAGAQPVEHMKQPDIEMFQRWQQLANYNIRLVTLAPEEQNGMHLIQHLNDSGVVASVGHSDATYEEVEQAVKAGATHVTHLFNGMRGLHHREPGVAGAALLHDELFVEMIADGIHIRPEIVKIAYRQKTSDRVLLISDAIRAKCLKQGSYDLGGQDVQVGETRATLSDGTLAGSILKMKDAMHNMFTFTDCSMEDMIQMTASNPAKQLGVDDRKGSIAVGKDADLVLLDDTLEVEMTFCRGKLAYQQGGS